MAFGVCADPLALSPIDNCSSRVNGFRSLGGEPCVVTTTTFAGPFCDRVPSDAPQCELIADYGVFALHSAYIKDRASHDSSCKGDLISQHILAAAAPHMVRRRPVFILRAAA